MIRKDNIPLVDGQIYRISCKYRNVSGSGTTYVGVAGIAANGTTFVSANGSSNPVSAQYYVESDNTTSTALDEAYGYICSAGTDTTGMTGVRKLHASCQFFRPLLITNFPNAAGSTQFDWFKVEAVDKTNTASIQTAQTSLNGLSAQYTVKVDVGGRVSGFGLASTAVGATPYSNFAIRADSFYIAAPTGGTSKGTTPFMVLTSAKTINGTSVPAGTYIESAYIHNGSIDTAKIKNLAVDTAQIANGAIETAKIGKAQVDSLQIAGEAVTIPRLQYTNGVFRFYTIDTEEVINTLSMDAQGGAVSISFGFESLYAAARGANSGSGGRINFSIKRKVEATGVTTNLRTFGFSVNRFEKACTDRYGCKDYGIVQAQFVAMPTFLDTPPAGKVIYTITLESRGLNAGFNSSDSAVVPVEITARSLLIMGVKR